MSIRKTSFVTLSVLIAGAGWITSVSAQGTPASKDGSKPASKPTEAEIMAQMTALAKPGEQHRLLSELVGTWTYTAKFGMAPGGALSDLGRGTAVRTAIMDGRYFVTDVTGTMLMPGPGGKMENADFKGMELDGYDNVTQKFVSTWIDNMGTSIVVSEGSYDPATKSFTYVFEMEMVPGMKTKAREVVKIHDMDHYQMDWFEEQGGKQVNTMQIDYIRQK